MGIISKVFIRNPFLAVNKASWIRKILFKLVHHGRKRPEVAHGRRRTKSVPRALLSNLDFNSCSLYEFLYDSVDKDNHFFLRWSKCYVTDVNTAVSFNTFVYLIEIILIRLFWQFIIKYSNVNKCFQDMIKDKCRIKMRNIRMLQEEQAADRSADCRMIVK